MGERIDYLAKIGTEIIIIVMCLLGGFAVGLYFQEILGFSDFNSGAAAGASSVLFIIAFEIMMQPETSQNEQLRTE